MGCYDTIYSFILVDEAPELFAVELQTKDLGCNMNQYILKENGQLCEKILTIWSINEPPKHPESFDLAKEIPTNLNGMIKVIACSGIETNDTLFPRCIGPLPNYNSYVLFFKNGHLQWLSSRENYLLKKINFFEASLKKKYKDSIV